MRLSRDIVRLPMVASLLTGVLGLLIFWYTAAQAQERQLEALGSTLSRSVISFSESMLRHRATPPALGPFLSSLQGPGVLGLALFDDRHHCLAQVGTADFPASVRLFPSGVQRQQVGCVRRLLYPIDVPGHLPLGYVVVTLDISAHMTRRTRAVSLMALVTVVGLGVAALLGLRCSRAVLPSLHALIYTVDRLRSGVLDAPGAEGMPEELQLLQQGIHDMGVALAAQQKVLRWGVVQATEELGKTLKRMEVQHASLAQSHHKLQGHLRRKSTLLATLSHELRTPLNSMLGLTQQLLKRAAREEDRDLLQTIAHSGLTLLRLIEDLLDIARLESGKLMLHPAPFALSTLFEQVAELLAPSAYAKGVEFTLTLPPLLPSFCVGDAGRVRQILTNVVANAIKFTPEGQVDVVVTMASWHPPHTTLRVDVYDSGLGLTSEDKEKIFEEFVQLPTAQAHQGSGLGLVITKKLVEAMRGTLDYQSTPGQGSHFWFTLPLKALGAPTAPEERLSMLAGKRLLLIEPNDEAAHALMQRLMHTGVLIERLKTCASATADYVFWSVEARPRVNIAAQVRQLRSYFPAAPLIVAVSREVAVNPEALQQERPLWLFKPFTLAQLAQRLSPRTVAVIAPPRLRLRVMAVDDHPANLKLMQLLLTPMVEEVVLCASGAQALEALKAQPVDLVLMDLQMPEMNGYQCAAALRRLHRTLPIIAVTAHALPGEQAQIRVQGMNDVLVKPVEETRLYALLRGYADACVSGLDVPSALCAVGGNAALLHTFWAGFLEEGRQALPWVQKIAIEGLGEDPLPWLHRLHGVVAYCGLPRLKRLLERLERSVKQSVFWGPGWIRCGVELSAALEAVEQQGLQ